ncbi:MAG: S8 family serine peptidase [Hyphomicrobium sp.]|nr:S8 family serine peptidase [Hyphomicrobium sp.]
MMRRDSVRASTALAAVLTLALWVAPSHAQSRDVPNTPPATTPNGATTTPPSDQRPGSGIDGLPDAVTVLDILGRLPRWPGGGSDDDDVAPPDRGPKPKGQESDSADDKPRRPSRVVTINPGQPFSPRPSPRATGAPPAVTGAVVPAIRDREVVVTLSPNAGPNAVFELSQDLGLDGSTLYTSNLLGTRVVRFIIRDTRSVADVVQQLATDARVQVAQPSYVFTANGATSPPPVPQYAPQKLHLAEAHKIAVGKKVRIAIIDTGIDTAHPVFGGAIAMTFDALGEEAGGRKAEPETHGTAVAGIVSARAGLQGVAPQSDILGVRAFTANANSAAQSHTLAILKSLDWAALNGARVVNMSFAGPNDVLLGQAIAAAVKHGVTIVAAAGNAGPDAPPAYPGAYPNVIAVTAIDDKDALYQSANRGTYIAVAAPGVDIIGASPNGGYDMSSGTSMAAAHVSGVAALLLEQNPKLTPRNILDRLSKSARQPPRLIAEDMGAGIVDAAEALQAN